MDKCKRTYCDSIGTQSRAGVVLSAVTAGVAGVLVGASSAQAASATWDGGAATNVLNTAANWTADVAPSAAGEIATWDGSVPGDLSLTWSGNFGPTSGNSGGVSIDVTGTNTGALALDATSGNFGLGNITIATGAGAFTLGDGAGTATVVLRTTGSFTNNSAGTATFGTDLVFLNGGGVGNRNITFTGTGNWNVNGTLVSSASPSGFGTSAASALLTKTGTGTLTLNAANAHGGGTNISAGVVAATASGALGTAGAVSIGGVFGTRLDVSNNITLGGVTTYNLTGRNNTPDSTSPGASIRNVSGNNEITGNINFANVGGTNVNILSLTGTLTLSGGISTTLATAARTFNFTGAGNINSTGIISDGSAAAVGGVGVIKNGAGVLTLSGPSTYTGPTTISGGTLALGSTGSIATTPLINLAGGALDTTAVASFEVGTGTTLRGQGGFAASAATTINGTLTLGATHAAPGSAATLNVTTGDVTLGGSEEFDLFTAATLGSADRLNLANALVYGGTLKVSDQTGATLAAGQSWDLFDFGSRSGLFANDAVFGSAGDGTNLPLLSGGLQWNFDYASGVLSVSAVPEPTACGLLAVFGGAVLRRRRGVSLR